MGQNGVMTQQPFSARGAIDLGALASARQNEAKAAEALATAPAGVIIDVTEESFERDVIQQSTTVPVVLDLWATWCQPCKQLSPLLERLAAEAGGTWILAKVDVDANPRIAQAFQVQSIPSVFAVIGGQPIPLFQGVYPEAQLRQVLDELLRVAAEQGVTGRVGAPIEVEPEVEKTEPPLDPRMEAAFTAIEAGDWVAAEDAYRQLLQSNPNDADAQAGLALVGVYRRTDGVDADAARANTDPSNREAQCAAADFEALDGNWSDAFDRLLACIRATSGPDRDAARAQLIEFFTLAGDDPAVPKARTALASALF